MGIGALLEGLVVLAVLLVAVVGARAALRLARRHDDTRLAAARAALRSTGAALELAPAGEALRGTLVGGGPTPPRRAVQVQVALTETVVRVAYPVPGLRLRPGAGVGAGDPAVDQRFAGEIPDAARGYLSDEVRAQLVALHPAVRWVESGPELVYPGQQVSPGAVDRMLRQAAALARAVDRAGGDLHARVVGDPIPAVRLRALRALGRIDAPRAVAAARERLLVEADPAARVELAGVGGVEPVLLTVVGDPAAPDALRARAAAWTRDARGAALRLLVDSGRPALWAAALDRMADRPDDPAAGALRALVEAPGFPSAAAALRARAVERLPEADWARSAAVDALTAEPPVRRAAAVALARLGTAAELPALRAAAAAARRIDAPLPTLLRAAIDAIVARSDPGGLALADDDPHRGAVAIADPPG